MIIVIMIMITLLMDLVILRLFFCSVMIPVMFLAIQLSSTVELSLLSSLSMLLIF